MTFFFTFPPLHLHHEELSFSPQAFLFHSIFIVNLPWSYVIPSPYYFFHHSFFILPFPIITFTPAITEITFRLHSTLLISIPLKFSFCPPRLFISRHRRQPLAAFLIILTLIISLKVPAVHYLYVLDVLYPIKAVC